MDKNRDSHAPQGLYITATPIGNMGDITLRAIEILGKSDIILCEDTREAAKLAAAHGFKAKRLPYHEHNADEMRPQVIRFLREGKRVALISDAGMPLISDPGYKLVRDCIDNDCPITCAPGANAALTALVLSGLPTDRFFFAGFLPPKTTGRQKSLEELKSIPSSLIFYETAPRLTECLADMAKVLGDRPCAVARELTKKFEEVRRGTLSELALHYANDGAPKGEIVIVIGKGEAPVASLEDMESLLKRYLHTENMSVKDAVARVAQETGIKKKEVYSKALDIA